jgi:hypothetical protein
LFTVCTVIYFAMCGRSAVAAPPEWVRDNSHVHLVE